MGKERPLPSDRGEGSSHDGRSQSSRPGEQKVALGTRSPEFEPQVHPWLAVCLRISGCLSPGLSILIYETGMLFSTRLRAGLFMKVRKDEVQMRGRSQGRTQPGGAVARGPDAWVQTCCDLDRRRRDPGRPSPSLSLSVRVHTVRITGVPPRAA